MNEDRIWKTKLAAWLHDPAEKALILYRAQGGHEAGTVAKLNELCFAVEPLDDEVIRYVKLADHWASAADRPSLPKPKTDRRAGDKVLFWGREGAELIHPLAGDRYRLPDLYVDKAGHIEDASFRRLQELVNGRGSGESRPNDFRSMLLTLWRNGPADPPESLDMGRELWRLLPADTRIPDHSIWEHLNLTSAFAGAMAGDSEGNPALLSVSLGPVQGFIAQARTVTDLWAGSHFLARLSWEAMKVVCQEYGPDSIIFPNLWGVPIVDLWLKDQGVEIPEDKDSGTHRKSDANPLFSAALPNRFVALVPASAASGLASRIEGTVRSFARRMAEQAAREALKLEELPGVMGEQIEAQMSAFPEVHWAAVPWKPLIEWTETGDAKRPRTRVTQEGTVLLRETVKSLLGQRLTDPDKPGGFLGSEHWELLQKAIEYKGAGPDAADPFFFEPNPGVLYPALYEVLENSVSAAKAIRGFEQDQQEGYRCSLCGEREWLTHDRVQLTKPPGGREKTPWSGIEEGAIARRGEHLCSWCTLKRGWPRIFTSEVEAALEMEPGRIGRYVVSTHTMALARDLQKLIREGEPSIEDDARRGAFDRLLRLIKEHQCRQTALPRSLVPSSRIRQPVGKTDFFKVVRGLPSLFDEAREYDELLEAEGKKVKQRLTDQVAADATTLFGHKPEAYYAFILFDGDRMGAWVSGADDTLKLTYEDTWHSGAFEEIKGHFQNGSAAAHYMDSKRAPSPARHLAISGALNNFSLHVARWVVEDLFLGKLIYSGGDDVLAMVSVDDLLPCLLTLRCAYSGTTPGPDNGAAPADFQHFNLIGKGYVNMGNEANQRPIRMMGGKATASAGAVIAHHTAPLQGVLRELRAAEYRAKNEGGRNAFSISLMKRAGGTTHLTEGWGFGGQGNVASQVGRPIAMGVLYRLATALASKDVSRRAAYHILEWMPDLPEHPDDESGLKPALHGRSEGARTSVRIDEGEYSALLATNIAYQLKRQGLNKKVADALALDLVSIALDGCRPADDSGWKSVTERIRSMVIVSEFLARQGRTLGADGSGEESGKEA